MVEERRPLKRLCKNSRRNLQGNTSARASKIVPTSEPNPTTSSAQGEPPPGEDIDATLDEIGGNGPSYENLESSDGVRADSPALEILVKQSTCLCSLRVCIRFIMPIPLAPYPLPPAPAPPANGFQNQLVCSGCRNLLLYPLGATSVCCAVCNAVTAVPPPGIYMPRHNNTEA